MRFKDPFKESLFYHFGSKLKQMIPGLPEGENLPEYLTIVSQFTFPHKGPLFVLETFRTLKARFV